MTVTSQFRRFQISLFFCIALLSAIQIHAAVSFKPLLPSNENATIEQIPAIQGGLLIGKTDIGNSVWLDDNKVRVATDGSFIIGFGRDAISAKLRIEQSNGEQQVEIIDIQSREYKIERVDGLAPSKVNPKGDAVLKRISAESKQVKAARTRDDERQDFIDGFIWPAKGRISGVYGSQRILNGDPKWPHYGVDIAGPTGKPVIAPASGIVTIAHPDMYYSGGTLIIDHGHGLSSTFLHLSEIMVEVGEKVEQGKLVAKIGATGRVTGPHLDWRMNWFNVRLDAELLVKAQGIK